MEVDIVTMTSKGQLVIPQHMREELKIREGEKIIIVRERNSLIMRPVSTLTADVEEELVDMSRATKAWEEIEGGKGKKMPRERFLRELAKW